MKTRKKQQHQNRRALRAFARQQKRVALVQEQIK